MKFLYTIFILLMCISLNAQVKIACIGTSITHGLLIPYKEQNAYPQLLNGYLGTGYSVGNFGYSGGTVVKTQDISCYFDWGVYYKQAKNFMPDVVVVEFGTNESRSPHYNQWRYAFREYYNLVIDTFEMLPTKPVIYLSVSPPVYQNNVEMNEDTLEMLRNIVRDIGQQRNLAVIDFDTPMRNKSLYFDGIHPTGYGAEIMAKTVLDFLKKNPFTQTDKITDFSLNQSTTTAINISIDTKNTTANDSLVVQISDSTANFIDKHTLVLTSSQNNYQTEIPFDYSNQRWVYARLKLTTGGITHYSTVKPVKINLKKTFEIMDNKVVFFYNPQGVLNFYNPQGQLIYQTQVNGSTFYLKELNLSKNTVYILQHIDGINRYSEKLMW